MPCKECGSKYVVNKTYCLCDPCNQIRLHGRSRFDRFLEKERSNPVKGSSSMKSSVKTSKRIVDKGIRKKSKPQKRKEVEIVLDELFYKEIFDSTLHQCQECKIPLPDYFRDSEGRVVARWQYSHVVPKSIAPELRRVKTNINRLCFEHHQQWENGDKSSMSIFEENLRNNPQHLTKYKR